jgi:type I restriction enzyme, S subunit
MASNEHTLLSLTDIASICDSERVPLSAIERSKRKGSFPYYGAQGIIDHIDDFIFEGDHVLVAEDGENLRSRKQPIAFRATGKFWVNNHAHIIKGKEPWLNDYIESFFHSNNINPYITGAAQPKLNQENLLRIKIPYEENHAKEVAGIWKTLQRKIELNREINEILKGVGRLLFRHWFVNFEYPWDFKKNEFSWDGNPYKSSGGEMVENNLGKSPNGWEINTIDELVINKKVRLGDNETSNLSLLDTSRIPKDSFNISEYGSSDELSTSRILFKKYDVLFSSIRPYFHKVAFANRDGVTNTSVFVLAPKIKNFLSFSIFLLFSNKVNDFAVQNMDGTKMPVIKWNILSEMQYFKPREDIAKGFNEFFKPILSMVIRLNRQTEDLEKIRDLLFPRLMSGKLRVTIEK